MRNYVGELRGLGYSLAEISRQSGIARSTLRRYETGQTSLSSSTDRYELIRNTSRRLSYQVARKAGAGPGEAAGLRRQLPNPDADVPMRRTVTKAKGLFAGKHHDVWVKVLWYHSKSGRYAITEGHSTISAGTDYEGMVTEAIGDAHKQLSGTGWEFVRLLSTRVNVLEVEGVKR